LEYFARMVSKARKRLASVEPDLPASSPPSRVTSHTEQNQRKQPKRRTLQSSPQDLLKLNEKEDPNSSNHIIPSEKTNQGKEPEEEQQQATEPHQLTLEREARERIFDEFKQEYFDIIEQVPLDLNRKFNCISELECSLEECKQELHEDLIAYTNFAKEVDSTTSGAASTVDAPEVEVQDEIGNRLRTLAQPMLWGVVPILPINSDGLPDQLKTLLVEISSKICRLQELSHDKLNLAESVYLALDRQLKRLDADLETYQDLEDQDLQEERRHHETIHDNPPHLNQLPSHSASAEVEQHRLTPPPNRVSFRETASVFEISNTTRTTRSQTATPRLLPSRSASRTTRSQTATPRQSPSRSASTPKAPTVPPLLLTSPAQFQSPNSGRTLRSNHISRPSPSKSSVSNGGDNTKEDSCSLAEKAEAELEGSPRVRRMTPRRKPSPSTPSATRLMRQARTDAAGPSQEHTSAPAGSQNTGSDLALYCSCQRVSFGDMVACDNPNCQGGQWVSIPLSSDPYPYIHPHSKTPLLR